MQNQLAIAHKAAAGNDNNSMELSKVHADLAASSSAAAKAELASENAAAKYATVCVCLY